MAGTTVSFRGADGVVLQRIMPALGPQHYKSFSISAPLASHWRGATCEEFECDAWRYGWVTTVDTSDDLGQRRFDFITRDKTRRHSVQHVGGTLYKFVFGPGFTCYDQHSHRVPIGRPPLLLVADGDFRGNPRRTPVRAHRTLDDFIDDSSTHLDRLAAAQR